MAQGIHLGSSEINRMIDELMHVREIFDRDRSGVSLLDSRNGMEAMEVKQIAISYPLARAQMGRAVVAE